MAQETQLQKSSVKQYLASPAVQQRTKELLGERSSQFITSITSMVGADDNLAKCEPGSLFMACLTAAALDLPVNKNLGFAHIVPYNNRSAGVTEAQFQLGWRGFVQLAQRSGQYKKISTAVVYQGQLINEDPLDGNTYDWKAKESDTVTGFVAKFILANGFEKELYMSVEEVTKHADRYSKAYNHGRGFGPWKDNFEAMALKTVVKLLISKWGPMSVDMQKAVEVDQAVMKEDGSTEYIDGELANVNATEDKKAAIIEANTIEGTPDDNDSQGRTRNA
jgi:recombination protein RecT